MWNNGFLDYILRKQDVAGQQIKNKHVYNIQMCFVIFYSTNESKIPDCSIIAYFKLVRSTPEFIFFLRTSKMT